MGSQWRCGHGCVMHMERFVMQAALCRCGCLPLASSRSPLVRGLQQAAEHASWHRFAMPGLCTEPVPAARLAMLAARHACTAGIAPLLQDDQVTSMQHKCQHNFTRCLSLAGGHRLGPLDCRGQRPTIQPAGMHLLIKSRAAPHQVWVAGGKGGLARLHSFGLCTQPA